MLIFNAELFEGAIAVFVKTSCTPSQIIEGDREIVYSLNQEESDSQGVLSCLSKILPYWHGSHLRRHVIKVDISWSLPARTGQEKRNHQGTTSRLES